MHEPMPHLLDDRVARRLFEHGAGGSVPLKSLQKQAEVNQPRQSHLCCGMCATPITTRDAAIDRRGQHEHAVTNPHGIAFRIGCFSTATGLAGLGAETDEYTWFPGYRWKIMLCTQCNTLLGWRFRGMDDGFYGLIVTQLMPCGGDSFRDQ